MDVNLHLFPKPIDAEDLSPGDIFSAPDSRAPWLCLRCVDHKGVGFALALRGPATGLEQGPYPLIIGLTDGPVAQLQAAAIEVEPGSSGAMPVADQESRNGALVIDREGQAWICIRPRASGHIQHVKIRTGETGKPPGPVLIFNTWRMGVMDRKLVTPLVAFPAEHSS